MASHRVLLTASVTLIVLAILFWVASVTGLLFGGPTPVTDLGLYAVTIVLVGFGAGGLLLWVATRKEEAAAPDY